MVVTDDELKAAIEKTGDIAAKAELQSQLIAQEGYTVTPRVIAALPPPQSNPAS